MEVKGQSQPKKTKHEHVAIGAYVSDFRCRVRNEVLPAVHEVSAVHAATEGHDTPSRALE
jgi:hypothetical protein